MISVEEARERVLARIQRLEAEEVPLLEALDRVLAEDIASDVDIAPFDNSAMDGYAVRSADVAAASEDAPAELDVVEHIPAGAFPQVTVGEGQASRIMTGAPVPEGADAVVMVERTRAVRGEGGAGGRTAVLASARVGENIRKRGEDVRRGEVVLAAGEVVSPAAVGLMAAMGRPRVKVYRRPRVAIVATGDELVGIDELPGPGKIRNANSYSLAAQVLAAGGEPHILPVARDNAPDTRAIISRAPEFDLMVSTGGVSMGDFDVVKDVLLELGRMDFWKVAMRPGAPQTYGVIGETPFFGLPGNPTSTMVGFELFVRPALLKMEGRTALDRPTVVARLTHDVRKKADRRYFLRARLTKVDDGYTVTLSGAQSSAMLTSMHHADCLASVPQGVSLAEAGSEVLCIRLDTKEGVR